MIKRFTFSAIALGIFIFFAPDVLVAQRISLHFPYFAGQQYDFLLMRGERTDTIQSGTLPSDGRLVLELPESRKGYAGMVRWLLRSGGGLDMVWNGEHFSVECLSATPSEENIVFTGSVENPFLNKNFREQELLLAQFEAMDLAIKAYPPEAPMYATFEAERERLKTAFATFQEDLSASKLYAARFREIVNFTRGITPTLGASEAARTGLADDFLSRKMSWEALYTSNHWGGVVYSWVQLHLYGIKSDTALLGSAKRILQRISDREQYTAFCDRMAYYFVKNSKDSLLAALAPDIRSSGKLLRFDGLLAQFNAVQPGEQAPDIQVQEGFVAGGTLKSRTRLLTPGELSQQGTVLVFYQSGCGPCETTMQQMIANYSLLKKTGFRVISIAADQDLALFEETAKDHPWPDKYCDGKGFEGPNFKNYGVAGTPTLFFVDGKGKVRTRAGGLPEILVWLENNN